MMVGGKSSLLENKWTISLPPVKLTPNVSNFETKLKKVPKAKITGILGGVAAKRVRPHSNF